MEENKSTKINTADYEDFEAYDIIQEVDLVSLNSTLLSALMQMNPILAVTLQASLAGFSIEEILRMGEQSQVNENYLNYIKQAKQDEKDEWNLISRIKSYTSILITIFNSSNEVFSLRHASWDYSGHPISNFDIQPLEHMCFTLRHETPVLKSSSRTRLPTSINHNFSFESASHAFEFSTLVKLQRKYQAFSFSPPTIPYREHTVLSIGKKPLKCSSQISRTLSNSPYSYAVAITLG
jgi:hypothetical protein